MFRLFSHPRFLAVYSGVLTIVFVATTALNLWHGPRRISAAEQHDFHHPDFDQLTVHRINIVEPDGTPVSSSPTKPNSPAASSWVKNSHARTVPAPACFS